MSTTPPVEPPSIGPPSAPAKRRGWTAGRIVSLVIGCILGLAALGLLAAGGFATWATTTQRDSAGPAAENRRGAAQSASAIPFSRCMEMHSIARNHMIGALFK